MGLGATLSDYVAVLEGVPKLTGDEKVEDILKEARGSMVCHKHHKIFGSCGTMRVTTHI